MRYARTVEPTIDPVTLDQAKSHCAIDGIDDHDEYLSQLIKRATAAVENHTSRQIAVATWTLSMDEFPDEIEITKAPVNSVSSIVYISDTGTTTTLAASQYQVNVRPNGPARIKPAYGCTWPSTRTDTYNAVIVTFTAGASTAATIPTILKTAVLFLVAHWFKNREPIITGTIVSDLPLGLDMVLAHGDWGAYA